MAMRGFRSECHGMVGMVSLDGGFVLLVTGDTLPITHFFDGDGDDCEPEDAVCIVAGSGDLWLSIEVSYSEMEFH